MKKLAVMLLLCPSLILLAATKPAPNPADYPLSVQVIQSHTTPTYSGAGGLYNTQVLETLIEGKPVELQAYVNGLFPLGTYKARMVPSPVQPKNKTYDLFLRYELIMPDGTLRAYDVTGLGPVPTTNP